MPGKARQAGGLRRGRCRLQVTQEGDGIDAALRGVTALDVVAARAGQAVWCGAVRPHFLTPREAAEMGPVRVPGMRHPLLLQVPWWPGPQQRSLVLRGHCAARCCLDWSVLYFSAQILEGAHFRKNIAYQGTLLLHVAGTARSEWTVCCGAWAAAGARRRAWRHCRGWRWRKMQTSSPTSWNRCAP